jgi:ketosteroid isomerase-like protein
MKPSALILVVCAFVAGCGPSEPGADSTPGNGSAAGAEANSASANHQVEAEFRELDQVQAKAWLDRDQAALERLWSPDFVLQAPSNQILTRDGVFREMRTPRLAGGLASMERTVERVTQFGDIVITMGVEHPVNKTGPTAGVVRTQRYTNVWRREGNAWRVIARHAHLLPLDPDQSPSSANSNP